MSGTTGRAAKTRSGSETKAAQNKTMGHLDRNVLPELFLKGSNENGCQDLFCDLLQLHGMGVGGVEVLRVFLPQQGSPGASEDARKPTLFTEPSVV